MLKADKREKEVRVGPLSTAEKKRALRTMMAKVNKKAQHTVISFADDVVSPYFLRRPSGIMQLDIDTGGGLPAGGISMISGPDNAGKSFLLYKYMAEHQRIYGKDSFLGFAPTEGAPDYFFMRKVGMQIAIPDANVEERDAMHKLRGLPAFTKEERADFKKQVGEFCIISGNTGEDLLNCVLASVRDNIFGLIAIDSFSMLLPEATANKDDLHEYSQQAANATLTQKFLTQFCHMMLGVEGRNDTTIIGTQQVRANRKKSEAPAHIAKYLPDYVPTGGWAAKHGKLIDLLLQPGEKVREGKTKDNPRGYIAAKYINWTVIKGKAGTHDNIKGDVEFSYEKLTEDLRNIVVTGITYKAIIEEMGLVSLVLQSTGLPHPELDKIAGVDRFLEKMATDFELELAVRREVLAAAGIECAFK